MAKKLIALDDGHGMETSGKRTPYIKELGRSIRENEFNRKVVYYLDLNLRNNGFDTIFVAPSDKNIPLSTRVNIANNAKADLFISIHFNAFDGRFDDYDPEGIELHIYPGSVEGRKIANCVMKYLKKGTRQVNRGIKENSFYVLSKTKMPALLTENGFMDNKREAMLMLDTNFQKEVAREHAQGICEYFNIKHKETVADKGGTSMAVYGKKRVNKGLGVKQLQADLISIATSYNFKLPNNFLKYGADGSFGDATEEAVKVFQGYYGLKVDGISGPATQAKIQELLKSISTSGTDIVRLEKQVKELKTIESSLKNENANLKSIIEGIRKLIK